MKSKINKIIGYLYCYLKANMNNKKVRVKFFSKINKRTEFEGHNFIGRSIGLYDSFIGFGTYISNECEFTKTKIGRFCSIARNVKTIHGAHPTSHFVSTHPAFYSTLNQAGFCFVNETLFKENKDLDNKYSISIGNDVWIGNDVRIMEGVSIGNGAIIGACSLVLKDVPPYAIVGGVPAHIIRFRFEEDTVRCLLKIKWWDWSLKYIKQNYILFSNIKLFIKTIQKNKSQDEK